MAEQTRRPRRADRYTQAPQRVSDAAAHPASAGENAVPSAALQEQSGAAQVSRYPSQGIPQMAPQTGFPQQGAAPYPPQGMPAYAQPAQQPYPPQYAQQQYQQQAMQQEMALQEAWQREQQRQMQLQKQQRQEQQRQERERVSSQTSSHGAFRGYTGEIPVGPGNRGAEPPAQPKPGKRLGLILVLAALAVVLITGGVVGLQSYQRARQIHEAVAAYDNFFAEGVYVDGIHLGGMTPEQGQNSVQSQIQRRNDAWLVTLSYQGTQMAQINAGMLGMSVDIGQVLNDAWAQARYGTDEERYAQMQALREHPYEAYTATPSGDTSVIDHVLLQVKSQIDRQAVNARLLAFDPTQAYPFSFQEESSGLRLNTEELRTELYHMVSTMSSGTLELQPETVEPEVHILDLQKHYMLRSSVYTPISTSSEENRNNNIRRAFEFINGYVLQPGDQFSFNSVVGQRTEENGFFPAIEYAYGEHVMGIGGGVFLYGIRKGCHGILGGQAEDRPGLQKQLRGSDLHGGLRPAGSEQQAAPDCQGHDVRRGYGRRSLRNRDQNRTGNRSPGKPGLREGQGGDLCHLYGSAEIRIQGQARIRRRELSGEICRKHGDGTHDPLHGYL